MQNVRQSVEKYIIEKSCTKLKFMLILKEFRFVQRVAGNPCRKFAYTLCWAVTLPLGTVNRCAEESPPGRATLSQVNLTFSRKRNTLN